ncbi:hypothetical protein Btru_032107 [Bulinus truncatus]|nr:hypothetical protein Btru_032107 [Bulinus truncatus]
MELCRTLLLFAALTVSLVGGNPISENKSPSIGDTCGIEGYDNIKKQLLMYADVFDSLYRLHTFANASAIPTHRQTSCVYNKTREECQKLKESNTQGGDTCPSVRVENVDRNRVPCVMEELRCQCEKCMFPKDIKERETENLTCKPIYHYVPVMRNEGKKVKTYWTQHLEPIVVGCKCEPREGTNPLQKPKKCKKTPTTKNTNTTTKKPKNQDSKPKNQDSKPRKKGKGTSGKTIQ